MTLVDLEDISYFQQELSECNSDLDYVDSSNLKYSYFYKHYLQANRPCVLRGITNNWNCQSLWVLNGKPNLPFFKEKYGNAVVPVADCNEKYYNSQNKVEMKLSEYADYMLDYVTPDKSMPCLYLKDWHFQRDFPDDAYKLPLYFASDWLNEYLLNKTDYEDDYRFVYIGPRGSWTPFHSDVFSSFSWSVNICGKKKWVFYTPGEEKHLSDRFGQLTYSVESKDLTDKELFPHQEGLSPPLVLIQEVGDAVFVPSGWHHQVWNLEDTISINHNWVNGCNISLMWEDIIRKLSEVEEEIDNCKDMEGWTDHCQLLLRSVYGMDISQFFQFISYTANVRLEALRENKFLTTNLSSYVFGRNHIIFDLFSIRSVLKKMLKEDLTCITIFNDKIKELIEFIDNLESL